MSLSSIQPHFSLPINQDPKDCLQQIQKSVESDREHFDGQFTSDHALVSFHPKKRRFWSPWLHLEIRQEDAKPVLYGWFTPHPSVWTGFVFSYLVVGCLTLLSIITGLTQQLLKFYPWGYAGIPVMVAMALVLWGTSRMGQKLAKDEMDRLKQFARNSLNL